MRKFVGFVIVGVGVALVAAAVIEELRKPREQREWHGRLAGIVPYEFRPPTSARIREAVWNPDDDRVLTDTAFGVGWAVNLAEVKDKISRRTNGVAA